MRFRAFLEKNLSLIHSIVFAAAILLLIIIANDKGTDGWDVYRTWYTHADLKEISSEIIDDDDAEVGKLKVYELALSGEVGDNDTLTFFVIHCNTKVYINDRLATEIKADDSAHFGKTPGSYYVYVPLSREDEDAIIRVEIEPIYKSSVEQEVDFKVDLSSNLINNNFRKEFWQIFLSFVSILLGVVFFLIARFAFDNPSNNYIFHLSFFALLIGIWKLMDNRMMPELLNLDPKVCSYVSLTMFFFMAPPFVMFAKKLIGSGHEKIFDFAFVFGTATGFVSFISQLAGIADYRQILFLTHLVIGISLVTVTVIIFIEFLKHRDDRKLKAAFIGFLICLVGAIADFIPFFLTGIPTDVPFTLLAFDIFILITGTIAIWDLNKKASTDFNTGLYNRSRCTDLITDSMIFTKKSGTVLVMIDLNFLKKVNDTYGHAEGDKMIIAFANILNNEVPGGSFTGRYGGDEFIIVLYGDKSDRLVHMLEGIKQAVEQYNKDAKVPISYSEGHAASEEFDGCRMKELFALADERMYKQKREIHEKLGEKMYKRDSKV